MQNAVWFECYRSLSLSSPDINWFSSEVIKSSIHQSVSELRIISSSRWALYWEMNYWGMQQCCSTTWMTLKTYPMGCNSNIIKKKNWVSSLKPNYVWDDMIKYYSSKLSCQPQEYHGPNQPLDLWSNDKCIKSPNQLSYIWKNEVGFWSLTNVSKHYHHFPLVVVLRPITIKLTKKTISFF